ncbi:MAG: serine/threonine protein kinase [Saprospiraceae bacterium]|nr:serine/threonine protein kinase [Saprospiraceae bacterium]
MEVTLFGNIDKYTFDPDDQASFIGRGGMSNVFKGYRVSDSQELAIKVLHRNMASSAFVQFLTVIASTVRIQHSNVMKMYELIYQDGIYHVICKYYRGSLLSDLIESGETKKMHKTTAWVIMSGMLDGLYALHSNFPKIIHRDIKPSNILITKDSLPVILDFGIAKVDVQRIDEYGSIVETNRPLGTPDFSSPEQLNGNVIDATSDLYAAAITFHRLLSGSLKSSISSAIASSENDKPLIRHPNIPESVYKILKKATDLNPLNRFQDALSMKQALESEYINFWSKIFKST